MKKRNYTKKQLALIVLASMGMILLSVALNRLCPPGDEKASDTATGAATGATILPGESQTAVTTANQGEDTPCPTPTMDPAEKTASFLQGPRSWKEKRVWSGEWGDAYYDGGSFGGFGCGLCCMANIYTTLTPYECSPLDMYRYAKKKSGYGGGGAIDWAYIKATMQAAGFTGKTGRKPSDYEKFQKIVKESMAVIVVISSSDSTCYWKDTPGHYVTLFHYDETADRVFLTDSGDPDHNRERIPLKKVYRSLKTANTRQYFSVTEYRESADRWKHHGYGGTCILPQ